MTKRTNMICIVCPIGCHLEIIEDEANGVSVSGNTCKRGEAYGRNELVNPTRVLTSTVKINGALFPRLPVKTNGAIPKNKIFEAMQVINIVVVDSPVHCGDILIKDILGLGVDIVAARSM